VITPTQTQTLPRLLRGVPPHGAMDLAEHLNLHGEPPTPGRLERSRSSQLIELVEQSGLRGHGGAAFPTARKMRAVADARGRPIVLINAAEGEPASLKDRMLLETLPHLVLEGGQLAAQAVGADEVILCVCASFAGALDSVVKAIKDRRAAGLEQVRTNLAMVPSTYIAGQESALVNHLNGGPAKPLFTSPMLHQRGVKRRPTLINNAETLAHLALIARYGPQWFRQLGSPAQPGSTLVTLHGPVTYRGVYEIEHGTPLSSLIDAAGGTTEAVQAVLLGGYAGSWIDAQTCWELGLCEEELAPHGASLGAGVIVLLSQESCPVAEVARVMRWLAAQSAGQCGPCVHGLAAISHAVEQVAAGMTDGQAMRRIAHLTSLVSGRGGCRHPDGALRFIASALEVFAYQFSEHARRGPCRACSRRAQLPLPADASQIAVAA
jgi:NADH:ubiquinone oxidoreductase subunit F (NADH-binding)